MIKSISRFFFFFGAEDISGALVDGRTRGLPCWQAGTDAGWNHLCVASCIRLSVGLGQDNADCIQREKSERTSSDKEIEGSSAMAVSGS